MRQIFIFAALALTVFLGGCTHKPYQEPVVIVTHVSADGKWKITRFDRSGSDESTLFANFIFQFVAPGAISVSSGSSAIATGTFSQQVKDGRQEMVIHFNDAPFSRLN